MDMKALVIDDDPDLVAVAKAYLENFGMNVVTANDGKAGIEKALEVRPGLVLVDLMMPNMHGWQVCERLRAEPSLEGLRILVVSSKSFQSDIDQAKHAGADDYLRKPYMKEQLYEKLRALLGSDFHPGPGGDG